MEKLYYRPIPRTDLARPDTALRLAGGWCWFDEVEVLRRGLPPEVIPAQHCPEEVLERLTAKRRMIGSMNLEVPRVMGILNATPDSFSDGGDYFDMHAAMERAEAMVEEGVDIFDIGGESTRPGAETVPEDEEIERTVPLIQELRDMFDLPISIDTRKALVADAAVEAGADMINDVSAMEYDPGMAELAMVSGLPICLMHAQGDPETMQDKPEYDDVLLDVYDHLEERIALAEAEGIDRAAIISDVGIGFGKTVEHNLTLLRGLSLFHSLGCPILLGVSRKRFIGTIAGVEAAKDRMPGTLAVTLAGIAQGVQIHRVHDVAEIKQGVNLWAALTLGWEEEK
ncbi:dihydropteroate synthase [Thioclava litoralis]|uniref:Dihydropteroate synthase n=1 Tax=Thioclava litoralis TaxID=3076557 RepID=A0ABZ1E320_9RHOB|nr:dihydropteroate synthase [Thioclava sp. FTW29]